MLSTIELQYPTTENDFFNYLVVEDLFVSPTLDLARTWLNLN